MLPYLLHIYSDLFYTTDICMASIYSYRFVGLLIGRQYSGALPVLQD